MNVNMISTIFGNYVSALKLNSTEKFVYLTKDNILGGVLYAPSSCSIKMIQCNDLDNDYYNKIYSVDVIKEKTIGHDIGIGVIDRFDKISIYNANQMFAKAIMTYNSLLNDITTCDDIKHLIGINTDESFYNNILTRKTSDGAGRYVIDNNMIMLSPTMLPGTKSTNIDADIYYKNVNDYFTVKFIHHIKNNDVFTFMRFLYI